MATKLTSRGDKQLNRKRLCSIATSQTFSESSKKKIPRLYDIHVNDNPLLIKLYINTTHLLRCELNFIKDVYTRRTLHNIQGCLTDTFHGKRLHFV